MNTLLVNSRKLFFLVTFIATIVSCSQSEPIETSNTIDVTLKDKCPSDSIFLSSIFSHSERICLNKEIKLGSISEAKYCHGIFYLLDSDLQRIVAINRSGELESIVGQKGRANYEYINLYCFDVNPSNGEIIIYDRIGGKFLKYSNSGIFLRSFTTEDGQSLLDDFSILGNGNIVCCSYSYNGPSSRRGIWIIDDNGNFIEQLTTPTKNHKFSLVNPLPLFCRINDDLIGVAGGIGDDNIYHIQSNGHMEVAYHLDVDQKIFKSDLRKINPRKIPQTVYNKVAYFESENWLSITIVYDAFMSEMCTYYEKDSKTLKRIYNDSYYVHDMDMAGIKGQGYNTAFCLISPTDSDDDTYINVATYKTYHAETKEQ